MSAHPPRSAVKIPATVAALTPKQAEATRYHTQHKFLHYCTGGGARSTKTFRAVRFIVARALRGEHSRHAIVRKAATNVRASVWKDTLPKVLRLCFPHLKKGRDYKLNSTEMCVTFTSNGAEIHCLGLDDADRAERLLGMEFATIFANEISQLSYASVVLLQTRLAQNVPMPGGGHMPLFMLYDCNPPKTKKHWSYKLFIEKVDPYTNKPLPNPQDYGYFQMNPADNPHLPETTKQMYRNMTGSERKRFWDGEFGADEGGMWNVSQFLPLPPREQIPDFRRIVVAIDPPASDGKKQSDTAKQTAECGIIVAGLGTDGKGYVLRDGSMRGPAETWGRAAVNLYNTFGADCIVGEINQGGDMVRAVIHGIDSNAAFKAVRATRGKVKRAEPIAALYAKGRIHHAPRLDDLEEQMCEFTPDFDVAVAGYSPDRVDALVWALTDLMLQPTHGVGSIGVTGH